MGRRSDFERNSRDYYRSFDTRIMDALRPHLMPETRYIEPCAGDGALVKQLANDGHVMLQAYDIEPQEDWIETRDALLYKPGKRNFHFISNPPWQREVLHQLIVHLSDQAPTWMLMDANWAHTIQPRLAKRGILTVPQIMPRCRKIVSIGRVKWIEDSKHDGKDDSAWYLFDKPQPHSQTLFFGRT